MKHSVGLLLPMSTICNMSKNFEIGLYAGIEQEGVDIGRIEFVKEFIGQGGDKVVEESLDRLFGYHNVDMITGIVSGNVIQSLAEKFENRKKVIINNNLGEHVHIPKKNNEYIFTNSPHFWQQCWLMGKWASKNLGKNYTVAAALYDSGYAFQMMFDFGMREELKDTQLNLAIGSMPQKGESTDIEAILDKVEEVMPEFVFALFCEKEARLFLEGFVKRGLHHKMPVIGLPFLYNAVDVQLEGLTLYTSQISSSKETTILEADQAFASLGLETGRTIARAIEAGGVNDLEKLKNAASKGVSQANQLPVLDKPVAIIKTIFDKENNPKLQVVCEESIDLTNNKFVKELGDTEISSWMNSYLGI